MTAIEKSDYKKIQKLMALDNLNTFWDDVCKLTRKITSEHSIHRWQCLAEQRWKELIRKQSTVISGAKFDEVYESEELDALIESTIYRRR